MKKGLILVIITGIILFMNNLVFASTWSYTWANTYIEVPIYSSLSSYTDKPVASLYKDGMLVSDANITYNINGDWLYYLKDVNTSVPGEYKVWYKAIENTYKPGTCQNYKQLITFKVYDNVAPKINVLQTEINVPLGTTKMDYTEYFNVYDNLENDVVIEVDDSDVSYKVIGTYQVLIKAVDSSGNYASQKLIVNVVDEDGPVVTFLGSDNTIIIEKNTEVDFSEYFKAIDKIDGNVLNSLYYEDIDITEVGEYLVDFSFTDSTGNITSMTIKVIIQDEVAPTIVLSTDNIQLDYKTEPNDALFRTYLVEALDGIKDVTNNVEIDYSEIKLAVGSYLVYYTVVDDNENETVKTLLVNYVTSKAPQIITTDVKINTGEVVDLYDYVTVIDESDSNAINNVEIDTSNLNTKEAGIYYLNVVCHNSSNLYSNTYMKVEVIDNNELPTNILNIVLITILVLGVASYTAYTLIKKKRSKNSI